MSAVLAFTTTANTTGPDYIDEPCSFIGNVSGSRHSNNVTYVNFLPAAAPPTRLRITQRGKRVLIALIAIPLIIAAFAIALNGGGAIATNASTTNTYSYVTVSAGESLWQLAHTIAPQADPRDVVDAIVRLNQIQGEIQPGMRLAVPSRF